MRSLPRRSSPLPIVISTVLALAAAGGAYLWLKADEHGNSELAPLAGVTPQGPEQSATSPTSEPQPVPASPVVGANAPAVKPPPIDLHPVSQPKPEPASVPEPAPEPQPAPAPVPEPAPEPQPEPAPAEPPAPTPPKPSAKATAAPLEWKTVWARERRHLADPNPRIRAEALLQLAPYREPKVLEVALALMEDHAGVVQLAAREVLATRGDPDSVRKLLQAARGDSLKPTLRAAVLHALAAIGDRQALSVALDLLDSRHAPIVTAALNVLGSIPDRASVSPLIAALHQAEAGRRGRYAEALTRITGERLGPDPDAWEGFWAMRQELHPIGAPHDPCASGQGGEDQSTRTDDDLQADGFGARGRSKTEALARYGGDAQSEETVRRAQDWLARHQDQDGGWNGAAYGEHCQGAGCEGPASSPYRVGLTGLALLTYLGAGHTHQHGGFQDVVRRGLEFLKKAQAPTGKLSDNMYEQGIASFALAEAYGLTRDCDLKGPAQRALDFILWAQRPRSGWDYQPRGQTRSDTSVTGWQIFALKSGAAAGLSLRAQSLADCLRYFEKFTLVKQGKPETAYAIEEKPWDYGEGEGPTSAPSPSAPAGKTVERDPRDGQGDARPSPSIDDPPPERIDAGGPAMICVTALCRMLLGHRKDEGFSLATRNFLPGALPGRSGPTRLYTWYYGTLTAFQLGDAAWTNWNQALRPAILTRVVTAKGCAQGSFPATDDHGSSGGRIYTTALAALCLESYYRYDFLHE